METSVLIERARETIGSCHCPYSEFRVAAVIVDSDGDLHTGVNIENSSFGLSMCAERVAIFKAVSSGRRDFEGILVYSPDGEPYPCGACRQVLAEFCRKDMTVVVATDEGTRKFTVGELIPNTFRFGG